MGWYAILLVVCIVGLGLVVFSRHELEVRTASSSTTTTTTTQPASAPPTASDHWQAALSVDICGKVVNLPRSADLTSGIISDGNGVVDIQPARAGKDASKFEGSKATLGLLLDSEKVGLASDSLKLPKSIGKLAGTYANGRACGTKPGRVQLLEWSAPGWTNPFSAFVSPVTNYANGELFMLAFVPKGAAVPKPAAASLVEKFYKVSTAPVTSTTTTTKPGSGTTTTTSAGSGTTTTTSAGTSTTTTKPAGTTTTAG